MQGSGVEAFLIMILFIMTLLRVLTSRVETKDKWVWFIVSFMFPFVGFILFYLLRIKK